MEKIFLKTFTKGTYYKALDKWGNTIWFANGGSGRQLLDYTDCADVKGSVASSYIHQNYGYDYNGKRTMVYLEVQQCPDMDGYYYVDDSNTEGVWDVIDFYYHDYCNTPNKFRNQGVITVDCYLVVY